MLNLYQKITKFFNFLNFPEPNPHSRGGVAILAHEHIPLTTTFQAVAIRVFLSSPIGVSNIYLPPGPLPSVQELQLLLDECLSPLFLVGDLNSKSPAWGSDLLDRRGYIIEETRFKLTISEF